VKRPLLLLGLVVGVANAVAAAATLALIHALAPEVETFGYFGRAPFSTDGAYQSDVQFAFDSYGFPWEYVAVPAVLIVLNVVVLPLALRRRAPEAGRRDDQ
jgi:4-amino-4-deoxy-L-arabinose transferase-like glycosyltransferase